MATQTKPASKEAKPAVPMLDAVDKVIIKAGNAQSSVLGYCKEASELMIKSLPQFPKGATTSSKVDTLLAMHQYAIAKAGKVVKGYISNCLTVLLNPTMPIEVTPASKDGKQGAVIINAQQAFAKLSKAKLTEVARDIRAEENPEASAKKQAAGATKAVDVEAITQQVIIRLRAVLESDKGRATLVTALKEFGYELRAIKVTSKAQKPLAAVASQVMQAVEHQHEQAAA